MAFGRLLARVSKQPGNRWILKGGLALEWQFGDRARTTMDIDATLVEQMSADRLLAQLRQAAGQNAGDWFEILGCRTLTWLHWCSVRRHRFPVGCLIEGRAFERFRIEVGTGGSDH